MWPLIRPLSVATVRGDFRRPRLPCTRPFSTAARYSSHKTETVLPLSTFRVADGSPPLDTSCSRSFAHWRASSGVTALECFMASFRVLPAELRYWTTHVRAPLGCLELGGFTLRANPFTSLSR